jgi:DNA-binding response OmpR family regulator
MHSQKKILLIERGGVRSPSFAPALRKKGYVVEIERGVQAAIDLLNKQPTDVVILDAASMKTSGARMSRRLRASLNSTPLILLIQHETSMSNNGSANEILYQPFTARKLLNRVARLLPANGYDEICIGPIRLDTVQRVVRCHGRETHITPKCVAMLRLLIARQGHLVKRETMMRRVWHTDYTGDMRTIDVHASWLRKAIELDPRSPCYLKTIRGMGYRLDIPEE